MRFANLSSVAVLGLVAGAASAEPQLTVLTVPNSGPVRGEVDYTEPAANGDVAYLATWVPDDFRPGEGMYLTAEWRRSTNSYRRVSTSGMMLTRFKGITPDGSSFTFHADDTATAWARWSSATGTQTTFTSRQPLVMTENLFPYIAQNTIDAAHFFPYFVRQDDSVVNFPASGFDAVQCNGLTAGGVAYGGAMNIVGNAYFSVPFTWAADQSVLLLPSLPGGVSAEAVAITSDGAVIVRPTTGTTYSSRPHYRWTSETGYQQFTSLPAPTGNYYHTIPSWSSSGRLNFAQNGSSSWIVWTAERGIESAPAYLQTQGVDLAGAGLTSIKFHGMKEDGRVFFGTARQSGRYVGWFVTGLPLPCVADFNGDGFVDFFDYDGYVVAFEAGNMSADTNGDGFLDFFDYDAFVEIFETGC